MTLQGKTLWLALSGSLALGVVAGVTVEGWRKARGLPPLQVTADAGVRAQVDAGASSRADCAASIEHWNTVYVPGPTRYLPAPDGGLVAQQPEVVTILVPDIRLTGSGASGASAAASGEAEASARVLVAPGAPERHWEVGPSVLYGLSGHQVLWGVQAGWSGGPFDVRGQAMKGPGDVFLGVSVGWRF